MNNGYPNISEAEKIFDESILLRRNNPPLISKSLYIEKEFIAHSYNVAKICKEIAARTAYLNPEKAYVLGLLHDYGKIYDEKYEDKSHGQTGYELMMEMGYPDVARVCLTHTFPTKNFAKEDYWYPPKWQEWIKEKLKNIEYDDYDRLVQLCDKFCEGTEIVSIEFRLNKIKNRYNLPQSTENLLRNESLSLKAYFDKLCGEDVYKIIGIKE